MPTEAEDLERKRIAAEDARKAEDLAKAQQIKSVNRMEAALQKLAEAHDQNVQNQG